MVSKLEVAIEENKKRKNGEWGTLLSNCITPIFRLPYFTTYDEIITYLLVTPSILFFCIAETTTPVKRCADMGA